ncbi:MAG: response regulator [Synergistaceae bacterium]|nr:response regulator [Synergistaceae bacterium]
MKRILIVDDNITSLRQAAAQLAADYEVLLAKSGALALQICIQEKPDLILLDVEMPDMDGFETLARLRQNPWLEHIPVIFLTSRDDVETEVRGLSLGARDFISKPVEKSILLHRLGLHLRFSAWQTRLENSVMEMSDGIASSFADLIECRDESTGGHVMRTSRYVEILGREVMKCRHFSDEISAEELKSVIRAAPLHDIGKIAISDRILLKPARLNEVEFTAMKRHTIIGAEILKHMYERTPAQRYLQYATMIAASHHERYDGKGYPQGLEGNDIPLIGRIMAVADVYDALVDDRVYRSAMSPSEARSILLEGRGTQFDPILIDIFDACSKEFEKMVTDRGIFS